MHFALKAILSNLSRATLAFFWLASAWHILLHLFLFSTLFICQRLARCSLISFPLPGNTGLHSPALFAVTLGPPEECGQKWCMPLLGLAPKMLYTIFYVLSPLFTWLEAKNYQMIELGLKDHRFLCHWLMKWQQPDLKDCDVSKK